MNVYLCIVAIAVACDLAGNGVECPGLACMRNAAYGRRRPRQRSATLWNQNTPLLPIGSAFQQIGILEPPKTTSWTIASSPASQSSPTASRHKPILQQLPRFNTHSKTLKCFRCQPLSRSALHRTTNSRTSGFKIIGPIAQCIQLHPPCHQCRRHYHRQ